MTTTPMRRSARVSKAPERLAATSTTPRKRGKAGGPVSGFPHPTPASSKRQRTGRGRRAAPAAHASESGEEADEDNDEDEEAASASDDGGAAHGGPSEASGSESDAASDFGRPRGRTPRTPKTPRTPRRAPRRGAAGGARARRTAAASTGASSVAASEGASLLLDALLDDKAAVAQVAMDWIEAYREGADAALCELVNFVIRLTGCRGRIAEDALYETEGIAAVLEGLQEQTIAALKRRDADADADDLLLGRTKEHRRLRKSALQMVQRIVVDGQHQLVFAEVSDTSRLSAFSETVLQWLANMAGSSYRPFRHVATLVALAVQTALVSIRAQISGELQTTQRQLEAELRRARRKNDSGDRLRARVAELTEQDEAAAAAFGVFYSTVFIYRYRDVHAAIRAECLVPLASWCRAYPAAYLDTEHLRFLGWSLNDKDARVRETALTAISGSLVLGVQPPTTGTVGSGVGAPSSVDAADASVAEGIRPFIARFLPRLVQVAAGDIDARVQVAALKLVALLARHGFVDATAKIGDIRNIKAPAQPAGKRGTRRSARSRTAYSNSLSQQLLEESDSEPDDGESDDAGESADVLSIQVLEDARYDGADDSAPLACPQHSVMRYLAPLVAHTHASVRAAAAGLVAWWLSVEWTVVARVNAIGVDRTIGGDDDDDVQGAEYDASASVDSLLVMAGGRRRARKWLLFKSLGAFLWHVSHTPAAGTARAGSGDSDAAEWWVQEQAATCAEELWAATPTAVGLSADEQHAMLAGAAAGGLPATALDARIEAAVAAADQSAALPRLAAAAQALWHRVPELEDLEALAGFLAWDHSARGARDTVGACFALAAAEETALLQAFAAWVTERSRTAAERARRTRSKKAESEDQQLGRERTWQGMFVPLLARHSDSPRRLLPLMFLAVEALDLQALFDAGRTDVIAEAAAHAVAVLARHGRHVRLAQLAAHFLERVDDSRLLPGTLATSDAADGSAGGSAAGDLVSQAARAAASQLGAARADPCAPVVVLRALIRTKDISPLLRGDGDGDGESSIERLYGLVEQAAVDVRGCNVGVAVAALDVAFLFVLWRALRLDHMLSAVDVNRSLAEAAAARLQDDRDRILGICTRLVDSSSSSSSSLLCEHAFAVLGRGLRLFAGPLTRASDAAPHVADIRRALAVPPQPGRLAAFYESRLTAWARLVAQLSHGDTDDDGSDVLQWYRSAPSSWSIAYARFCAVSGLWAQWIGDQTVSVDGLAAMAAYTGMLGLEPVERRRVELALGHEPRAAPRRKVGFVPLSTFDHIVQAAVEALKPQLDVPAWRDRVVAAYMSAMRAAADQCAGAAVGGPPVDAVNVGTLARFVGGALKATGAATAAGGGGGRRGEVQLAPVAVGAAWAHCHAQALDAVLPDGAACDERWEARAGPWFVALAQTVHGVLRPRHAETLAAQLRELCERAADADAARSAAAPYQRALDKELAKLGAIRARMAEARALDTSAMEIPTSPARAADDAMDAE